MDFDYLKQKRILLVDDEQELLDMVSSIFTNEGFCNVKTAKTVKEALCIAETFQPELAILDVMLPDGNGFDLMKQLKNKSDYPVLFLTARGEDMINSVDLDLELMIILLSRSCQKSLSIV